MAVNKEKYVREPVTLTHEQVARIAEYRFAHKIASKAEAIRRLIDYALDRAPKPKRK